jgi:hypothetical protein
MKGDIMFDRLWEFFTSDDRTDKLIMRISVIVFLVAVHFAARYLTALIWLGVGILILGVIIIKFITDRSARKAEERWQETLNSVDDGVSGYIKVRPDELEAGLPWEAGYKPKTVLFSEQEEQA